MRVKVPSSLTGTEPAWQTMVVVTENRSVEEVTWSGPLLTGTMPVWQTGTLGVTRVQ